MLINVDSHSYDGIRSIDALSAILATMPMKSMINLSFLTQARSDSASSEWVAVCMLGGITVYPILLHNSARLSTAQ
jgi:hypothetical protein